MRDRLVHIGCSVGAVVAIWVVWIIAYYSVGNDYVIPSFQDTFVSLFACLGEGSFWLAFLMTFARTAEAFSVSFLLAAACAAGATLCKIFRYLIEPVIVILRTLPTLAVILIILIWTNAKVAPVIVTVILLFPMIYAQMCAAVGGVDGDLLQMAKAYDLSKRDRLFKIYLPLISPNVFSQAGANISLGLKVMISAEVLSNTFRSLGGLMQTARSFLDMPRLAALTLIAVIFGLIIELAFSQLKRINAKWFKGGGSGN